MLKKIKFSGFKGKIFDEIELKPITLLFGPNSAGKSTVIQIIHYIKEILDRRNYSPRGTKLGGNTIDLGGFKNFVLNHDLNIPVTLELEFDLSKSDLPGAQNISDESEFDNDKFDLFSDFSTQVQTVSLMIHVSWINSLNRAEATYYSIYINGKDFISLSLDYDNPRNLHSYISNLNINNPVIRGYDTFSDNIGLFLGSLGLDPDISEDEFRINLKGNNSVIPNLDEDIFLEQGVLSAEEMDWFDTPQTADELHENYFEIIELYKKVIISVGILAKDELNRFRYIGPIREIPPRNYEPHFEDEIERWANGFAAWDLILNKKINFKLLNNWLEKLKINYRFEHKKELSSLTSVELKSLLHNSEEEILQQIRQQFEGIDLDVPLFQNSLEFNIYKELKDGFDKFEKTLNKKIDDNTNWALFENNFNVEVKPHDVGIGISQVLPIIVAVLTQKNPILAIEQPELHIHPALQVELADLFIDGINKNPEAIYLIETHSEHFILRLLRRIEETTKKKIKDTNLELKNENVSVYFIDNSDKIGWLKKLPIDDTGEFTEDWPGGFFEEREEELFPDD
jgi:ABC-type lipoprotein export system ATPase subunit